VDVERRDPAAPATPPRSLGLALALAVAVALAVAGCEGTLGEGADIDGAPPRRDAGASVATDGAAPRRPVDGALPTPRDAAAPDAMAPPDFAPRVTRFELIATDPAPPAVPAGAPGNAWGGHQSRVARLSSGEIYATYMVAPPGNDPAAASWVLLRRGAADTDRWSEVGRGRCGREPMHLVRTARDGLELVSWPSRPTSWTITTGAAPLISEGREIPGAWQTHTGSGTPYSGLGISPDGHVCLVASRGSVGAAPRAIYTADSGWDFACRAPGAAWGAMTTLPIGLRYAYPFVLPRDGGAWDLVATRDVLWEGAGYARPRGAFAYVLNAVDRWRFASPSASAPEARDRIGALEPASGGDVKYEVADAMIDREGLLHVITKSRTSGGTYQMRHLRALADGSARATDFEIAGYTDGAVRLLDDGLGRLVLLFTNGDALYVRGAGDPAAGTFGAIFDLSSVLVGRRVVSAPYVATRRGGTVEGPSVDFLVELDDDDIYYVRIVLH
jgi:hypothetical protein